MKQNAMNLLVVGIVAFYQSLLPFIGSRDYSFGVLTPRGKYKSPQLYTNRWAYFISVYMITFVAANYIYRNTITSRGLIMILAFMLMAYLVLVAVYHQKSLDGKKTEAWTDTAILREIKGVPSQGALTWASGFLKLILLTAVITGALYAWMPAQMTMLGFLLPKSLVTAMLPVLLQAVLGGVVIYLMLHNSGKSAYIGIAGAMLVGLLLPLPFSMADWFSWQIATLYGIGIAVIALAGGLLLNSIIIADAQPSLADTHWKMGIFYINKDDPAILVPKRFGLGFTPNLANSKAIGLSLVIGAAGLWLAYRLIMAL